MNDLANQRYPSGISMPQESLAILRSVLAEQGSPLAQDAMDPPLAQFFLQLPTHPNLLPDTLHWFDHLPFSRFSARFRIECKTMLGEAVDNVRDHAHENLPPATSLFVAIIDFPSFLCLQIWDQGQGFDLVGHLRAKEQWPDSGATRGRGLKILEELSDCLAYIPCNPKGNCLILVKRYE